MGYNCNSLKYFSQVFNYFNGMLTGKNSRRLIARLAPINAI